MICPMQDESDPKKKHLKRLSIGLTPVRLLLFRARPRSNLASGIVGCRANIVKSFWARIAKEL